MQGGAMDKAGQGKKESHSRSAQDIYRAIFDNVNDAIFLRDLKTRQILDVNSKLCEMTGYTAREIKRLPRGWFSARPVQDGKTVASYYEDAANGEPQLFEWQGRRKDGMLFWVEVSLIKVAIGGRECLLSVMRDIGRRRQEQEELRQSQARYRNIVEDQAEFLVCHFLADGTMTFVNEALCRCAGVRREEVLGKTF
jgi:PAS domain S-box-containing protein